MTYVIYNMDSIRKFYLLPGIGILKSLTQIVVDGHVVRTCTDYCRLLYLHSFRLWSCICLFHIDTLMVVNLLPVLYYQAVVASVNTLALHVVDDVIIRLSRYDSGYAGSGAVIEL